ncbi:MAG TPA: hypothetical protein PK745_12065, partial [bacterium]|nr:hypothetical protein [bacterium]
MNRQSKTSRKARFMTVAVIAAAAMILCGARAAFADEFKFELGIPSMPRTPVIKDIVNSSALPGAIMTVYATIEGREQMQVCCGDNCDRTDCEMAEWWNRPDPAISPNPPCIPNPNGTGDCLKQGNPKLYYYVNDIANTGPPVTMSYNSASGKFKGEINLAGTDPGDIITYYIVAADSRGNVASQLPSINNVSCSSVTSWNNFYETAATNNCTMMSSYERCSVNQSGTPLCGTTYSVNDPTGDTCGEPDENGVQSVVSGWQIVDTRGFSASAGKGYGELPTDDVVCAKIRLGGQPPQSGSGAIEMYSMHFFNPDIDDMNIADTHYPNAFTLSFAPKAEAIDPNLAKVLWNGDCVTNPNTPDPMACKIFVGTDTETKLKIGFTNSELRFIAKNALPNGKTLLGSTSKSARMLFATSKLQLTGGVPYFRTDITPSLEMIKDNRSVTAASPNRPAPPIVKSSICKTGGAGSTSTCAKQGTTISAAGNNCVFDIFPSPDKSFVSYYNVYYNTVNDRNTATLVESLSGPDNFPENGSVAYSKTFNIPDSELNGHPRYFYFSAVNSYAPPIFYETMPSQWTSAVCVPEDWVAPVAPAAFTCSTPIEQEEKCYCTWVADKVSDPSLYGFDIKRDGVLLNATSILPNSFDDTNLINATTYSYEVRAIDVGDNKSGWTSATCATQDLKPPAKIEPIISLKFGSKLGVNINWNPGEDEDLAGGGGYNIYYCKKTMPYSCGADEQGLPVGYSKLNASLIPHPAGPDTMTYSNDSAFGSELNDWCFWIEACDNCKAAGTCPESQTANCGLFDATFRYRKCIYISVPPPYPPAPLWPENQKATAEPEGQSCKIEWNRVCAADDGYNFTNCYDPSPYDLLGYKIMRAPAVNGGCAQLPNPDGATPIRTVMAGGETSYTDSGALLENGVAYCYRVYAYNMFDAFSRQTPAPATSGPVVCVPQDITPPEKPRMNAPMEFDVFSCSPAWSAVSDKNPVTYDVHRCEGDLATCNSAAKFSKINSSPLTVLNYMDESVTSDAQYVYCVTAKDPSGNQSAVYDAQNAPNCGYCDGPGEKCLPPVAVEGFEIPPTYYGARAGWTNSADDDGMGAGYHVYLCTSSNPASCLTPYGRLTASPAPGAHDRQLGQEPLSLYSIPVAVSGDYYLGVSYTGVSCGESMIAVSPSPVRLETQDPCAIDPDVCPVSIEFIKPFTRYEIEACAGGESGCIVAAGAATGFKKVETPLPGVRVEVVDAATKTVVVKSMQTNAIGNIPFFKMRTGTCAECVDASKQYIIRAVFPAGTWD